MEQTKHEVDNPRSKKKNNSICPTYYKVISDGRKVNLVVLPPSLIFSEPSFLVSEPSFLVSEPSRASTFQETV